MVELVLLKFGKQLSRLGWMALGMADMVESVRCDREGLSRGGIQQVVQ